MSIIWVLVNRNSVREAKTIGQTALRRRLTPCFDIFPRLATFYFWPPRKGKIETGKGCLLVLESLPSHFKPLEKLIRRMHSDKQPFIGSLKISHVSPAYLKWLKDELTHR